jgi:hypothetical protein
MYTLYRALEPHFDYILAKGENAYGVRSTFIETSWAFSRVDSGGYKLTNYLIYETPIATFSSIEDLKTNYPELLI